MKAMTRFVRRAGVLGSAALVAGSLGAALAGPGGADGSATVTIYRQVQTVPQATGEYYYEDYYAGGMYGGAGYGGVQPASVDGAVVVERRRVELPADGELRFSGVAARLDGASVQFRSVSDPDGAGVVSQRFVAGVSGPDAVLAGHVGQPILVVTDGGEIRGILRAHSPTQLVLETDDPDFPVQLLTRGPHLRDIRFPRGAAPFATEPTLVWQVKAARAGAHEVEVTYRTGGITWSADYAAVHDPAAGTMDLSAWVSLRNDSGLDLDGTRVVLVEREVGPPQANAYGAMVARAPTTSWSSALPARVDLADGARVQLELFPTLRKAKTAEITVYEAQPDYSMYNTVYPNQECYSYSYGTGSDAPASSLPRYLEARSGRASGDLPRGALRVYRRGADGALELTGEDTLDPARTGGDVRVRLGTSSTVKAQRRQLSCQPNDAARELREKIEITVTNEGKEREEVVVREYMNRWTGWSIASESDKGSAVGDSGREWRVAVAPGKSRTLTYTVLYTW
jgi:hypothetical protein